MSTESLPEHIQRPHLRPIQPIGVQGKDGKPMIALRDPAMLTGQTMVIPMPAMQVVQLFRGQQTLEEIASLTKGPVEPLQQLAEGLDKVGLLWGPTFKLLEAQAKEKLEQAGSFPPRASISLGKDEAECRAKLQEYFDQTEDPELEGTVTGIIAPHLDYERGWPNYAAAYYALRDTPPPDRILVLGSNHTGIGDGVVLTEFGFETPLGRCPADDQVVEKLVEKLGDPVVIDQLDHLAEHSIELQIPWLQYCWGNVPLISVIIPDPLIPMIEEDDQRTTLDQFVEAMNETLDELGGNTFVVASSDLSHVGPQFGEPRPVDDQRRFDVERHDREMMGKFVAGDPEEFLSAFKWNKNPTRWCSIGNMTAALQIAKPQQVELLDYRQAYDERGAVMVTSAAMVMLDTE